MRSMAQPSTDTADAARELVGELLFAGLTLVDLLASLLDESPETAPRRGEATIELVFDICQPALAAARTDECLAAAALVRAVQLRVFEALHPTISGCASRVDSGVARSSYG
jgi:hypothetical protein